MPSDLRSDDHGRREGPAAEETRLLALEEKVTQLAARLDQMEQRLSGLSLPSVPRAWPLDESTVHAPSARTEMARWVTFLGRSCVVLGGAFLIRALTDGRILPGGMGVALGIAFASTWILFAHRAATRGATVSAGFHGVVAALVAYPLILEATVRLAAMSPSAAALVLVGFTVLLLWVSWRDQLGWLAWIGVLSCLVTTIVLLRATPGRAGFSWVLLVLAAATFFWLGDHPRWRGIRWLPAAILDLVILRAVLTSAPPFLAFSLALAGLSLGLVFSRTASGRPVGAFEVFQTVGGLVIGIAGALRASQEAGHGAATLAAGLLAVSLLAILFAGWVVPRRGNRDLDFLFYSALALALLSVAVALLTIGDVRGVLWSILALLTVLLGRRSHPPALWSLAAILALGAALSSGMLAGAGQGLIWREAIHWQQASPGSVIVLALIIFAYIATIAPPRASLLAPSTWASSRLPAAVLVLLASAGLGTLILQALHALTPDLARLAAARTALAVGIALTLALIRRRVARPELTWIGSLALVLGGAELVLVELPNGRPSTLLVSFVLYGAGLILVPRIAPLGRDLPFSTSPDDPMVTRS